MPENGPENLDEAKGRMKEATGDLTDDEKLRREGKIDRATGTAKDNVDEATDKAQDLGEAIKDKVEEIADKVKDKAGRDD